MIRSARALAAVALAAVAAVGCSRKEAAPHHPVVLIGVDGMAWEVAKPLLVQGKLPHLEALVRRGAAGFLYTLKPALSPVVWTTVATGTTPDRHGIVNFLDPRSQQPFTANARRGRALWDVATEYGLKSLCVGWWVSYPAAEVDGWMVAPYSAAGQNDKNWKGNLSADLPDQTWPRDLIDEIWPIAAGVSAPERFKEIDARYLGDVDASKLDDLERRLDDQTRWSVAADESFAAVATALLERPDVEPDLTMVYLGGPDVASHRFWRYAYPYLYDYDVPAGGVAELAGRIERFYVEADRMIGEIVAAAPDDANVIVCSDHGFHAVSTRRPNPNGFSAHHLDGPPGVIVMAGPDVKAVGADELLSDDRNVRPRNLGQVLEIAPVIHHLLGIPLARDLKVPDGGALMKNTVSDALKAARPPVPAVDSHDDGFRAPSAPLGVDEEKVRDFEAWLESLGYLGVGGDGYEATSPRDAPPPPEDGAKKSPGSGR
ncbi:MAG: alkaline phosphatase family protein [Planctomycetota bacterium JB042]